MRSQFYQLYRIQYEIETASKMIQSGFILVGAKSRESAKKKVIHLMNSQVPEGLALIVKIEYMNNDILI